MSSAKHPFQLLKTLVTDGHELVFNVDLMHPRETSFGDDLFEDIFDLGIREDYDVPDTHIIKSIALPSARIIFDKNLWSIFDVDGVLPTGETYSCAIPLIDEAGLILSKCTSVSNSKRERDAFDIFILLSGPKGTAIAKQLLALAQKIPQVAEQLAKLKTFLKDESESFDARVLKYSDWKVSANAAHRVMALLT